MVIAFVLVPPAAQLSPYLQVVLSLIDQGFELGFWATYPEVPPAVAVAVTQAGRPN